MSNINSRHFKSALRVPLLAVCVANASAAQAADRIYIETELRAGQALYEQNCASCHGSNGQGITEDWQKRDADGNYPPPPLNGTAHTWHHPAGDLLRIVKEGTSALGGNMPGWQDRLTDNEILLIINWITSLWPDEIYELWLARH